MESSGFGGTELASSKLSAIPNYAVNEPAILITPGNGRLINLTVLFTSACSAGTAYMFLFDSGDASRFRDGVAMNDKPLVAPVAFSPSDTIIIEPETKWLPFKAGLVIAFSTTDYIYTPVTFLNLEPGVYTPNLVLDISYHLMLGCG